MNWGSTKHVCWIFVDLSKRKSGPVNSTFRCPNTGCFNIWLALKTARCALRESGLDETSVIVAGRRPVMLSKSPVLGGSFHLVSVLVSLVHPSGLKWIKPTLPHFFYWGYNPLTKWDEPTQ